MAANFELLTQDALALPRGQRLSLAHRLFDSVESEAAPGAEAAWEEEIARRIAALDAGTVDTIPAEEVLARLRQIAPGRR